jgi:hypothetical protein
MDILVLGFRILIFEFVSDFDTFGDLEFIW